MYRFIRQRLRDLFFDERGPTTTEYAVMFALILLVCISSIKALSTKVQGGFTLAGSGW